VKVDTDTAWEQWGARDPYYGVLTDPRFRTSALTAEAKDEFFDSGSRHVEHVLDRIRHYFDPAFEPRRILDFGCGVGRLVIPFAQHAAEVVGMDIAPSMLAEARRNCDARGLSNVSIVMSDDALSNAAGEFCLVHSYIVLQHIEIARGREIFSRLVNKVSPGAFGAIHITFGWDFYASSFGQMPAPPPPPPSPTRLSSMKRRIRRWLEPIVPASGPGPVQAAVENPDPEMQMNFYNLSELMFILQSAGVQMVHSELADHGGVYGAFLFFQRAP